MRVHPSGRIFERQNKACLRAGRCRNVHGAGGVNADTVQIDILARDQFNIAGRGAFGAEGIDRDQVVGCLRLIKR